jgi:hypothetical protein
MGQTQSSTSSGESLVSYKETYPTVTREEHIVLNTQHFKTTSSLQEQLDNEFSFNAQVYQMLSSDEIQCILTFLPYKEETGTRAYHVSMYFGKRNGGLITMYPNLSLEIVLESSWVYYSSLLEYCRNIRIYQNHVQSLFNIIEKPQYKYLEQVKLMGAKKTSFDYFNSSDARSLLFVLKNENLDQKKMISKVINWKLLYYDQYNSLFLLILRLCPSLSTLYIGNHVVGDTLYNSTEYQQHSGLKEIRLHQTANINYNFLLNRNINSLHILSTDINLQLIQDREWNKIKLTNYTGYVQSQFKDWTDLFQLNAKYIKIIVQYNERLANNDWLRYTMSTWTTKSPKYMEKLSIEASYWQLNWNETHANGIRNCRNLMELKITNSVIHPEFLKTLLKPLPAELPDGYCMQRKLIMVKCKIQKHHLDELRNRFSEQNLWSITCIN